MFATALLVSVRSEPLECSQQDGLEVAEEFERCFSSASLNGDVGSRDPELWLNLTPFSACFVYFDIAILGHVSFA